MLPTIEVQNIGKKYIISHGVGTPYRTLGESLSEGIKSLGKTLLKRGDRLETREEFWALRGIEFKIHQGEKIGIIGRNGAGKTTLLKILSRITVPTEGRAVIRGRVSSLLEVGTGFHPELTGRENIFLNGSILGMKGAEIKKKFDEIVAFAEVEKFLDTPVKRFSSGMYVRLAFAVAAHLEPEILLVDEVLAVGDVEFQKKCLGKMGEVAKQGRTVLFVSHNMNAIDQLCSKVILLNDGAIEDMSGDVNSIITQYLFRNKEKQQRVIWENTGNEYDNPFFDIQTFSLVDASGNAVLLPVRNDSQIFVCIKGHLKEIHPAFSVGYAIYTDDNIRLYSTLITDSSHYSGRELNKGNITFKSQIPGRFLNEGGYRISAIIGIRTQSWFIHPNQSSPHIFLEIKGGLSDSPYWTKRRPGVIGPLLNWDIEYEKS
jgi:lipopolysaccharide transport system ATP-binding protein